MNTVSRKKGLSVMFHKKWLNSQVSLLQGSCDLSFYLVAEQPRIIRSAKEKHRLGPPMLFVRTEL